MEDIHALLLRLFVHRLASLIPMVECRRKLRAAHLVAWVHVCSLSVAMINAPILLIVGRNLHRARHHRRQVVVSKCSKSQLQVFTVARVAVLRRDATHQIVCPRGDRLTVGEARTHWRPLLQPLESWCRKMIVDSGVKAVPCYSQLSSVNYTVLRAVMKCATLSALNLSAGGFGILAWEVEVNSDG